MAPGLSAEDTAAAIAAGGGTEVASIDALRIHVVDVPAATIDESIVAYRADPRVDSADRDRTRDAEATPNDPAYPDQWALPQIGWDQAYGTTTNAGIATLAVLDTGVQSNDVSTGAGWSAFGNDPSVDPNGHGTWIASIAAATADNGTGIAGVGFDGVDVMPVQVLSADGTGQDSDIIAGLVWATDHGADVVVMAFSNPGYSSALQDAVNYAWNHGVVVVAAAGNDGATTPNYPAGDEKVVGVGATNQNDELWSGSNSSAAVFITAPGVDVRADAVGGGTVAVTGTSASAAVVAGAAAQLVAVDPYSSPGTIVGRLARNAAPGGTGNGRVNLARALNDSSTDEVGPTGAPGGGPVVGPYVAAARNLLLTFAGSGTGTVKVTPSTGTVIAPVSCGGTGSTAASQTVSSTCLPNITTSDNGATVTFLATATGGSTFGGWSLPISFSSSTCTGTTNPCSAVLGSNPALTVTFNGAVNHAPTATTPTFSPASPTTNSSLQGSTVASDADLDTVKVTFVWKITRGAVTCQLDSPITDSLTASGSTHSNSLDLSTTHTTSGCVGGSLPASVNPSKGDVITLEVTPNDNTVNGTTQSAQVTIGDSTPTISVTKEASVASVPEPGDDVTYTVTIENTSSTSPNPVNVTSITDAVNGGSSLAPAGLACEDESTNPLSLPFVLAPGESATCTFTRTVTGNAGDSDNDVVTVSGTDADGDSVTQTAEETVDVTDVPAVALQIVKSTSTPSLDEPGGTFSYSVQITNPSTVDTATISSITDSFAGALTDCVDASDDPITLSYDLAPGEAITCAFTADHFGNAGAEFDNTVTVEATDDDGANVGGDSNEVTVSLDDVLPTITVTKTANDTSIPETGQLVTFTFRVTNTSGEAVEITSLSDDQFGTLTGNAGCQVGTTIAVGTYCEFTENHTISGDFGGPNHLNTFTGKAKDDEGNVATATDSETITFEDVLPTITVTKTASVASVPEPSGSVTYTVVVNNTSLEMVTLTSLVDDKFGNLNGQGTCVTGGSIAPGSSYTCTFPGTVTGNVGSPHTNSVTAKAKDDELNEASATGSATVGFTNVAPTLQVTKTASSTSVDEPGASVTFTVTIKNTSVTSDPVTITALTDQVFPAAAATPSGLICKNSSNATVLMPFVIPSGSTFTCTFSHSVNGDGPGSQSDMVSVTGHDDENTSVTQTATTTVMINNVAPVVTTNLSPSVDCQTSVTLTGSFTDGGGNDGPYSVDINWGDGTHTVYAQINAPQPILISQSHTYALPGSYTVTTMVTDKDGGVGTDSAGHIIAVNQAYTVKFLPPFDGSTPSNLITNTMKSGRTVPVKLTLFDICRNVYVTGTPSSSVTIGVAKANDANGVAADPVEYYADAGAANGNTNVFRWTGDPSSAGGGFWIYNLDSSYANNGGPLAIGTVYRINAYVGSVKATVYQWALLKPVK
jgi:uncharacterized repeat protein (TIGR01451 family)